MSVKTENIRAAKETGRSHSFSSREKKAVPLFFQPKLTIGAVDDVYEREADEVADKVMRMDDGAHIQTKISTIGIHRKCAACEEEEHVQRKEDTNISEQPEHESIVSDALESGGNPLDDHSRSFMEKRFGYDFSKVKIHTNAVAAKSAQAINALAYTSGKSIVFNEGQFSPGTERGKKLLAHELTHVVQQNHTPGNDQIQRAAIHTGRILNHGSCYHLACNSRWACPDPRHGYECESGTRNAGSRMRPLFTCDGTCESTHGNPCRGRQIAIPHSRFAGIRDGQCGQDLVVCANHHFMHATVRDRSHIEAWELGQEAIRNNLTITSGDIADGAIYPDERDREFLRDSRCR